MNNLVSRDPIQRFKQGKKILFVQQGNMITIPGPSKEEVKAINDSNRSTAKGLFKGMISGDILPTMSNLGRMLTSAYNGWLDPKTTAITGEAPSIGGPTKAKNAWEALQMVKAMKAAKSSKAARQIVLANKPQKTNVVSQTVETVQKPANRIKASHGYTTELEIPNIPNYQELFDGYKMTKASRLNMNNILDKLPVEEKANVLKVIMGNTDKYLNVLGNITPAKASGIIRGIRRRLPGEYTPLRVKSLDQTKPSMSSGMLETKDATVKTAGFKRTTGVYKQGGSLISKNPIQRFEQGKKIVKAQGGVKTFRRTPGGQIIYDDNFSEPGFFSRFWSYLTSSQQSRVGMNGKSIIDTISSEKKQQQDTPATGKMVSNKSPLQDINYEIDNYISGLNAAQQGKIIDSKLVLPRSVRAGYNDYKNSQSIPKQTITKPINNRWVNGIQKRDEITDVRATQQMLKDAGFDIGKYGVDGKWGEYTENAYKKYLALKNVPTYEKPEMPSVTAMAGIYSEENKPLYQQIRFKQGGQLPSRNIIKRFKNKK